MSAPCVTRAAKGVTVRLDAIEIPSTTRPYNATAVVDLKRSIAAIGLQSAPTVVERDGRYLLVAGRHRLEALKLLGVESVFVRLVDMDDREARLWTISENLHRAELTEVQRSKQMAEFVALTTEKLAAEKGVQVGQVSGGRGLEGVSAQLAQKSPGRPEGGISAAARDLGVTRDEIRRRQTIAALPEATLAVAEDLGLDDNQAALLAAARAEEPDEQVEALKEIAARGKVSAPRNPDARPLHNLANLSAGEFSRWIKITTPHDPMRVIRMLRETADIREDEEEAKLP
jgi:ParB family chromosome partitioning protein